MSRRQSANVRRRSRVAEMRKGAILLLGDALRCCPRWSLERSSITMRRGGPTPLRGCHVLTRAQRVVPQVAFREAPRGRLIVIVHPSNAFRSVGERVPYK